MPIGHSVVLMMVITGLVFARRENETQIRTLADNCGSERQKIWYTVFEVKFGLTSTFKSVWKGSQNVYRLMVVHVNHAIARSACRSCSINSAEGAVMHRRFDEAVNAQLRDTYENYRGTISGVICTWHTTTRTSRNTA